MNILIVGANGYIGREIVSALIANNHQVTACVRRPSRLLTALGITRFIHADFLKDTKSEIWRPRLDNIDCVINCVGLFQASQNTLWRVHYHTPRALFEACEKANIKKIIHISALGVDKVDVAYAKSKLALEDYLQSCPTDSTIIRPSFVYGHGSYGGSALFRGLVGLPGILPLPGSAEQLLQPVHVHDLAKIVTQAATLPGKQLLTAAGDEQISLRDVLLKLRGWLGFRKPLTIHMPMCFLKLGAFFGNLVRNSPLGSTGIKMMAIDNIASNQDLQALKTAVKFTPRGFSAGLQSMVSSTEDRWFSRLYFLKPILRLTLAIFWLYAGITPIATAKTQALPLLTLTGISSSWQMALLYGGGVINILLGLGTLFNWRIKLMGSLQTIFILAYTVITSVYFPLSWLTPFGPLIKNIPLLAATWVMIAISDKK